MEAHESYIINGFLISGYFIDNLKKLILKISWAPKNKNILNPYRFHSFASSILPRKIREKLCDSPHEKHGCPVIFSCKQTTG